MMKEIKDKKYARELVRIYNDAIRLFPPDERGDATEEVFYPQLENDITFLAISEEGDADAFLSYHSEEQCYELTSLYVTRRCQNKGYGQRMLRYFEAQVPSGSIVYVEALKNAPWSIQFYIKNGYHLLDQESRQMAEKLGYTEKPWSIILYKSIN